MNRTRLLYLLVIVMTSHTLIAQDTKINGPMNAYSAMLEVTVWVQTFEEQKVQMRYWVEGVPDSTLLTETIKTKKEHGYTAHLIADQVEPGTTYEYEILVEDQSVKQNYTPHFQTQELWHWRRDPPPFSFVAGSCAYINEPVYDRPGTPYGGDYQIFESIAKENLDFMVWLGDNIYLREVDWNSPTGIYHRYTHMRSTPEMKELLATAHHYATWDDHDYGPNDSDRSYWGKNWTKKAFMDFWPNPTYGVGESEGITSHFVWQDCEFFMMDDRWYRGPNSKSSTYFGQTQLQWLVDALRFSRAAYKFVGTGGQIVSDAALFENYACFVEERQMLMDSIDKYDIQGVVFLTGDRHHSEISKKVFDDGQVVYDITSSALTSGTRAHLDEPNSHRIEGSMIGERNYALITITGPRTDRKCDVIYKNSDGEEIWRYRLER